MAQERPKLYLETSVVSYYTARPSRDLIVAANQQITHEWWETRLGTYEVFVSDLVFAEARRGDAEAAKRRIDALARFNKLELTDEAAAFAHHLVRRLPIPQSAFADAALIAIAAVNAIDYLATWNCRHMARGSVLRALPDLLRDAGYGVPIICTPQELSYEDREMD